MTTKYTKHFNTRKTPQSEPIPGVTNQVKNEAGGYVFKVDKWTALDRFLILGSEGGSYYVSEPRLTRENANNLLKCIKADGIRTVNRIVDISYSGRAPKNDPAIFALAACMKLGDLETRKHAHEVVPKVCRIGTHLFQLAENVKAFGGWGRATKRAFGRWYVDRHPDGLALQLIKYRNRVGWTHRDILRKAKPNNAIDINNALIGWAVGKRDTAPHKLIGAFERAQSDIPENELINLINDFSLPREAIPTERLNSVKVWDALLHGGDGMPIHALIRNLGKMSSVGLLSPMSDAVKYTQKRLSNKDELIKKRVHPLSILFALSTYQAGGGYLGNLTWKPDAKVISALNKAFYKAFDAVEPTGKRWLLALDVSGSMGFQLSNSMLSCRAASAALSLVTAATEEEHHIVGFTSGGSRYSFVDSALTPLDISPDQRLDDSIKAIEGLPFGGTDCSLPMVHALKNKIPVDMFVVYTDNETWAGKVHPVQALREYRQKMDIPAKLVVVGMLSNNVSIADPKDAGMLDVVGFDASVPTIMSDFAKQ